MQKLSCFRYWEIRSLGVKENSLQMSQLQNLLEEGFIHVEQVKHAKHPDVLHVLHGQSEEVLQLVQFLPFSQTP